jgi:hypothetical protein
MINSSKTISVIADLLLGTNKHTIREHGFGPELLWW